jgi:hypothetical protein
MDENRDEEVVPVFCLLSISPSLRAMCNVLTDRCSSEITQAHALTISQTAAAAKSRRRTL